MKLDSDGDVTVNGDAVQIDSESCLTDVVRAAGLNPDVVRGVAIALNDEVIRREAWAETPVAPGDRIEVVTAQQGG